MSRTIVDTVNRRTMLSRHGVETYSWQSDLTPPERAALDLLAAEIQGQPVLDLGVGGGRTTGHLLERGGDYTGLDYSEPMLAICRKKYPGQRLLPGDAREMPQFPDASFAVVFFSCNGIGMVDHEGRLKILREVYRVLRPGGTFAFSFHNQSSPDHSEGMQLPPFEFSAHPARLVVRVSRFLYQTGLCIVNYRRFSKHDVRLPDYSIINDRCHHYAIMLYYISLENQRKQLEAAGFAPGSLALDLSGNAIPPGADSPDDSLLLVARKI
jgi:ubiquinone/menaquinone biosynthesis C-methylase UbiE